VITVCFVSYIARVKRKRKRYRRDEVHEARRGAKSEVVIALAEVVRDRWLGVFFDPNCPH
jgi:hypothetical protein